MFFISQPIFLLSLISNSNEYSNLLNRTVLNSQTIAFPLKSYIGLGMAILGAFLVALSTVIVKKLNNLKVHYSTMLVYQGYIGVPVCFVVSIVFRQLDFAEHSSDDAVQYKSLSSLLLQCLYAFIAASSSLITHVFFNIGLKYEDPAKFSIIRISDLFFIFILQMLILDIYSNYLSMIGAMLIFISTFLVIFYKIIDKKYNQDEKNQSLVTKFIFYKL